MNLAMYNLPTNLKSSLHKTWQTLLLFLEPLQIHNLNKKSGGTWHIRSLTWKKGGAHVPRVPHQIAPMQPIMTLVQITNYTGPNCTDQPQVNIHCIENFFTVHDFWATCACPEKKSCPGIFHCIEYTFYMQNFWAICMRLHWKTELPWYFSLY